MVGERDDMVVRLLSDIEALRRSLRLYPASHPSLEPARERLRARVLTLGAEGEVLTASFGLGRIFWNGQELVLPPITPAARLVPFLFHLGLAAVRFTLPEAAEGVVELATRLAGLSDPPAEADRAALIEQGSALPGVKLVPIDLSGVQLLGSDQRSEQPGSRPVWAELAQRLSRDGAFPLSGLVHEGELSPGSMVDLLAATSDPESLFDHLFRQLAEIVGSVPEARRPVALAQVREYFAELVRLLDPERRTLAVATAFRHLPLATPNDPWVAGETLLDAVERMLIAGVAIPEDVQKVLYLLAGPSAERPQEMPDELVIRARHLLARIPLEAHASEPPADERRPMSTDWPSTPWANELSQSLGDEQIKLHFVRLLQEVITLWPGDEIAERAAVRLAEEFVAALDVGDIETAARLAPLLAATRSEEAGRLCNQTGVEAAVRALSTLDKGFHPDLTALLVALGERAVPAILTSLELEESLTVRRRLLEVVTRQGPKAVPYLLPQLDNPEWFVVRNAVFLLRRIGNAEALPVLKARIASCHPKVLAEILKSLVHLEDPDWLRLLERALDSEDGERRRVAVEVASRIRHPDVVGLLLDRLRRRMGKGLREPFSLELIRALGILRDPASLETLQQIVALRQWRYPFLLTAPRREAAAAIAHLEGPAARRAAISLASGKNRTIADAVRAAMHAQPEAREEDE
ncbi:MAG: HEAT repeat domain-containing protein [Thermoanaerobaculaceae bacterium]|jgi:HEAT repeat protein